MAVIQVTTAPASTNAVRRNRTPQENAVAAGSGRRKKTRMATAEAAVEIRPPVRP
jgi:hypothetical protein